MFRSLKTLSAAFVILWLGSTGLVSAQDSAENSSATANATANTNAATFKLASYNLENAFDVFDDPYTKDEGTDVKSRAELKAIAGAIRKMDADVVTFCELENDGVLKSMVNEFLPHRGYQHEAVIKTNDERGINLGLISRYPIESVTSYRWRTLRSPKSDETWKFARDLMHVKLRLPGKKEIGRASANADSSNIAGSSNRAAQGGPTLHLFIVHLKSKRDSPGDENSTKWRTAEARMVHRIVGNLLKKQPGMLGLVLGDFNSNPGQPAIQAVLKPTADGQPLLSDLHDSISQARRITFPSERYPKTIFDYMLATPAMQRRYVAGSAGIFRDKNLTQGSDHRPVFATFRLQPPSR